MADTEIRHESWYCINMSRAVAESLLKDCSAGAFVVRLSSQPNCVALSHRKKNGTVGHALIYKSNRGYLLEKTDVYQKTCLDVLNNLPLRFDVKVDIPDKYRTGESLAAAKQGPAPPPRKTTNMNVGEEPEQLIYSHNEKYLLELLKYNSLFDAADMTDAESAELDSVIDSLQRQLAA